MWRVCEARPLLLPRPRGWRVSEDAPPQLAQHYDKLYKNKLLANIVPLPSLNLSWCLVPKVASTSLSLLFLPLLPPPPRPTQYLYIQAELWGRAGKLAWSQYRAGTPTLLVTRHPWARLASAWRNKLQNRSRSHDGEYFYTTYSKQIIK